MLYGLVEAALRSLMIAVTVWLALKVLRIRNPHAEATAWRVVLWASIAMPLLMRWDAIFMSTPEPQLLSVVRLDAAAATAGSSDWHRLAWWGYVVVMLILLLRPLTGVAKMWRLRRAAASVRAPWTSGLDVRTSRGVMAPVTFASTVIVPADYEGWSDIERRAVLAHERTHIQRGDSYVLILAHMHRAVFWFSPLGWWLPRRLSLLSEQLADDAAVVAVDDPVAYAEMLLSMAAKPTRAVAAVAMAKPVGIAVRIERILGRKQAPKLLSPTRRMLVAAPLLPLIAGFAGCAQEQSQQPAQPSISAAASAPSLPPEDAPLPPNAQFPKRNHAIPLSRPEYPAEARRSSQQGKVIMRLYVLEDGSVQEARVKESSGFASLDEAATGATLKWRLDPGMVEGKPVPMWGTFAVTFKLAD